MSPSHRFCSECGAPPRAEPAEATGAAQTAVGLEIDAAESTTTRRLFTRKRVFAAGIALVVVLTGLITLIVLTRSDFIDTVRGKVVDAETREGIPGIQVETLLEGSRHPGYEGGSYTATTSADGTFELAKVHKGSIVQIFSDEYGTREMRASARLPLIRLTWQPQTLTGTITAPECGGGYAIGNATVEIRSENQTLIGSGTTSVGEPGFVRCQSSFTVEGLPKAKFYDITIGTHGGPSYTLQEMISRHWNVALSLGD